MALEDNTAAAMRSLRAGAAQGLNVASEKLLADSKALAPWKSGDLRKSGSTHPATEQNLEAAVTYSATSDDGYPYPVAVHEGTEMNFGTDHNPNAQAKYLEQPATENRAEYYAIVAAQMRRATS